MQVTGLTAEPDPCGSSILLRWKNPTDPALAGIKILRRQFTLPEIPADLGSSFEIYDEPHPSPGDSRTFLDTGGLGGSLRGETVYYYAVVALDNSSQQFPFFISAMATSSYEAGAFLYKNLPGIYQTYDTSFPPSATTINPDVQNKGQLLRLVEMFGLQLDLLRSYAAGIRTFFDVQQVDGNLLQLLAQWIGWQPDFTLPFSKQRNEISYASSFYRTTGVAANLRAMVSRVSTWDAHIKEFAHNIFRSTDPEKLTLRAMKRIGGVWQPEELVTLDEAHDGKAATGLAADGPRVFFHARQDKVRGVTKGGPRWHIQYKDRGLDGWLPGHRLTSGDTVNRHPAVLQRADGSTWLFWSRFDPAAGRLIPGLRLQILATGLGALRARIQSTVPGPFVLGDGDQFEIVINQGGNTLARTVTVRTEDFADIGQATAQEVAAVLDRELPYVDVGLTDDHLVVLHSQSVGGSVSLQLPASMLATKLGIAAPLLVTGRDATTAQLTGSLSEPFVLSANDQLTLLRNGDVPRTIKFQSGDFLNITAAQASEVAAAINAVAPGAALAQAGHIVLQGNGAGEESLISVDVVALGAAVKLGFGSAPPAPTPLSEPFVLSAGDQFLIRGAGSVSRTVVFENANFLDITQARASEVAAAITAVVPGAAAAEDGQVVLSPWIVVDRVASSAAGKLGLETASPPATVPMTEPFALSVGDQLVIYGNDHFTQAVILKTSEFSNIGAATAAEVAAAINAVIPGIAFAQTKQVSLTPLVAVDATVGVAATVLGLGTPDESEPSVFEDAMKGIWLFWSSRRSGNWKIWYSRFDGTAWGTPKPLTTGGLPDREPAALFDSASGRIWVFWSRKNDKGSWNIFFRKTTKLDFATLVDGDWLELPLTPGPPDPPGSYDNREPNPLLLGADSLELYFSSNRSNGWNTWSKTVSSTTQGTDVQVTSGQFTRRSPSPLLTGNNEVTVWFRTNQTQVYTSALYPSAQTVDARFSGSITADTRNPARLSLRNNFNDIQRYTYHAASNDPTLTSQQLQALEEKRFYSRDTVGVYLVPDTNDEKLLLRNTSLIAQSLAKFLPIQVRAVFRIDQAFSAMVYDYDGGGKTAPLIRERMTDTVLSEVIRPPSDEHSDTASFKFVRTWATGTVNGGAPDLTIHPPDTSFRMPIAGVGEGA